MTIIVSDQAVSDHSVRDQTVSEQTWVALGSDPGGLIELSSDDKPCCPACGAAPVQQSTVARERDGALELVVLVCQQCAKDHPVWF